MLQSWGRHNPENCEMAKEINSCFAAFQSMLKIC